MVETEATFDGFNMNENILVLYYFNSWKNELSEGDHHFVSLLSSCSSRYYFVLRPKHCNLSRGREGESKRERKKEKEKGK